MCSQGIPITDQNDTSPSIELILWFW